MHTYTAGNGSLTIFEMTIANRWDLKVSNTETLFETWQIPYDGLYIITVCTCAPTLSLSLSTEQPTQKLDAGATYMRVSMLTHTHTHTSHQSQKQKLRHVVQVAGTPANVRAAQEQQSQQHSASAKTKSYTTSVGKPPKYIQMMWEAAQGGEGALLYS
jgi:hypothetical protein